MRKYSGVLDYIENNSISQSIRSGLIMTIPVLMVGSFALILTSLPIPAYQSFIHTFWNGTLETIVSNVHEVSFGLLSMFVAVNVSMTYAQLHCRDSWNAYGVPITAAVCFSVFSGIAADTFHIERFGAKGMFIAILTGICASMMYTAIVERWRYVVRLYADGANAVFNQALSAIIPSGIVIVFFVAVNAAVQELFHADSVYQVFIEMIGGLFQDVGQSLSGAALFVVTSSILWLFGMHGSDVMEGVREVLFVGNSEIFTKHFLDSFVLIGGCGATLSLLVAILLFSRNRTNRKLSKIASVPMLFNVNEMMVFGLPIVLNPTFFIPFLTTPLACMLLSYFAMSAGLVPVAAYEVEWTTPVLLSGYMTTDSVAGSVLQLVNVFVGALIYRPFVRMYDAKQNRENVESIGLLSRVLFAHEAERTPVTLTELPGSPGAAAKMLALDLRYALARGELQLVLSATA